MGGCGCASCPGYSPELNPDEWVWKIVKHDRIGPAGLDDARDLVAKARSAMHRLQKLPGVIRGFFGDPTWPTSPRSRPA
jgi:hypothetical protein